ncbi:MAG: hypothetical protein JWO59_870 [Chloroflexi bacterium]|nr:hypothetical protein [Chloroflexota bacterium]
MELVLRAYDHETVERAESLPVKRLWTLLESGGIRDASKVRVGLSAQADVYAREAVVARLEALVQEGYGESSLKRLRGGEPIDLATLRRAHWPAIGEVEAVELREDLVRYLTYGLWRAPEEVVARALGMLTGTTDTAFLVGGAAATAGLQQVLDSVGDEQAFAAKFGEAVRSALERSGGRPDDEAVAQELARLGQLLGPLSRLVHGARDAGMRVIAYQDKQGGEGLTRFLAAELGGEGSEVYVDAGEAAGAFEGLEHRNGHGEEVEE